MTVDEHPRGKTTIESLNKLPSVFKKEGTVTAGNASGICDGAAANVIASEAAIKEQNLKPLARIVSYGVTACEPSIMGIGPVEAIKLAMSRAGGLTMQDIDLWEVNEAFAAQFLSVQKELELPNDKTNVFGGAIGECAGQTVEDLVTAADARFPRQRWDTLLVLRVHVSWPTWPTTCIGWTKSMPWVRHALAEARESRLLLSESSYALQN